MVCKDCGHIGGYCGDPAVNGGKNVTWTFDEATGKLSVSGTGAMADQTNSGTSAPWYGYRQSIREIFIDNGVTRVGNNSFYNYNFATLTKITLSDSVEVVGKYAFGVYLFHQIWVLIFRWFGISVLAFSPVISIPLFAIVFCLLSAPFAWLLYLIPGAGKWLT